MGGTGRGSGVSGIFDWVRGATVVITAEDDDGVRQPIGSGFFVAPGWVLSCAHVVAPARKPQVRWHGHDLDPITVKYDPEQAAPDGRFAFPDTAVLHLPVPEPEPPCVPISMDPPVPTHRAWVRGISTIRTGRLEDFASLLVLADAAPEDAPGLFRLQGGQLGRGMSGGPVLDVDTYEVCGITKAIQDEQSQLGGWAIPIANALAIVDEPLADINAAYHADSLRALRQGQLMFGRLPSKVLALFKDHPGAVDLLAGYLPTVGYIPPATLKPDQLAEWAVRRLFDLDLDELVSAMLVTRDSLGDPTALAIFDHVACCLPVTDGPAWWVTGDAALGLRTEAGRDCPRIVRVCTDEDLTVEVLMRRAFEDLPWAVSPAAGPASARAGGTDLPADTFDDIQAEILRLAAATEEEWATDERTREQARRRFRLQNRFWKLRVDAAPDVALLTALAAQFPGLRFLISKRMLALPEGVDHVLLDLVPPIDPRSERLGLSGRTGLLELLNHIS